MEFRILGPLEVVDEGRSIPLGGAKQRALLALLVLHANEPVSVDRIVHELWSEPPPATAAKNVQVYISHLRKQLGDGVLETRAPGYALRLADQDLDAWRAEDTLQRTAADPASARAEALRAGLALWRGPPLADLMDEPFAQLEIERLEELRLRLIEQRINADLELGRHMDVVGELERLVAAHPFRERFRAQLMLALYRSGRQADALAVYREARRTFTAELGLEPDEELRSLERQILAHDPALALPPPADRVDAIVAAGRIHRKPVALLLAGVALLVLAVTSGLVLSQRGGHASLAAVSPNAIGVIDPQTNSVVAQVPVGNTPTRVTVGEAFVWVLNADDRTVSQIDPTARRLVRTVAVTGVPTDIAAGAGATWVGSKDPISVLRIDAASGVVTRRIVLWRRPVVIKGPSFTSAPPGVDLAVAFGSVWAAARVGWPREFLVRFDPDSGRRLATIRPVWAGALAPGPDALFMAQYSHVSRIEPGENVVAWDSFSFSSRALVADKRSVWVADEDSDVVWQLDGATLRILRTIQVGQSPSAVAVGFGSVWVANADGTVSRIDPDDHRVVATIRVGGVPHGIATGEGAVWVSVG